MVDTRTCTKLPPAPASRPDHNQNPHHTTPYHTTPHHTTPHHTTPHHTTPHHTTPHHATPHPPHHATPHHTTPHHTTPHHTTPHHTTPDTTHISSHPALALLSFPGCVIKLRQGTYTATANGGASTGGKHFLFCFVEDVVIYLRSGILTPPLLFLALFLLVRLIINRPISGMYVNLRRTIVPIVTVSPHTNLQTSMRCRLVPIDVYLCRRSKAHNLLIACEHDGRIEHGASTQPLCPQAIHTRSTRHHDPHHH